MAEAKSVPEKVEAFLEKPVGAIQFVVDTVMRDGSIAALSRDGMKSIQNAWYDAAYGNTDHSREPGSPLTPLYSDIKEARQEYEGHGPAAAAQPQSHDAGEKPRGGGTVHGSPEKEKAQDGHGKVDFGQAWKDRVAARREQAEQERQVTPDKQQEQERERGR